MIVMTLLQDLYKVIKGNATADSIGELCRQLVDENPAELPAGVRKLAAGAFLDDYRLELICDLEERSAPVYRKTASGDEWEVWQSSIPGGCELLATVGSEALADLMLDSLTPEANDLRSFLRAQVLPLLADPSGRSMGEFAAALNGLTSRLG